MAAEDDDGNGSLRSLGPWASSQTPSPRLILSAQPTNDDEIADADQHTTKRSRVGAAFFQRTFSRASRRGAESTSPPPAFSPTFSADATSNPMAGDAPLDSPVDSPVSRSFSPFDFLSRVGSGTAATAGAPSILVATRTIKICLIGDVGAGKTALFK